MKTIYKKILFGVILGAGIIYFLSNTLINMIGVPLAAKHSYDAWQYAEEMSREQKGDSTHNFPSTIGVINDFENILSEVEEQLLAERIIAYEAATSREVAIVTIDSIAPYTDILKYTSALGAFWGVGKADSDNGLLICLAVDLKETALATGYGTEQILTDSICREIIESAMIPSFKKDKYYKGLNTALDSVFAKWN